MTTVGSYVVAFVLSHVINMVASVLVVPFKPIVARVPSMLAAANLAAAFVGGFGAVWAYASLAANTFFELAYLMLLLPALAEFWNDQRRIDRAKTGLSGMRAIMTASGEAEAYDQSVDIRAEQCAQAGRVIGYLAGLVLFVGSAPLLW
jgi:hypothetical protein